MLSHWECSPVCEFDPGNVQVIELFPSCIGNGADECAESPVKDNGH